LVGADLPETVRSGERLELSLHWSPPAEGQESAGQIKLAWAAAEGRREPASVLETWGPARWVLRAPAAPGSYELVVSRIDVQGAPASVYCGWLARSARACALAPVRVTEAGTAALASFDGEMRLLSADLAAPGSGAETPLTLVPGQSLEVKLVWQAVRPMQEDYTVSIQLVGPDGRLYGQTDTWPVQGTYPTSQWQPSEQVSDPYGVVLDPDAPPGRYRAGVVVYLLATQTRLPVVNDAGEAIDDVAWVGELEVVSR
jgi:hypothetical protein